MKSKEYKLTVDDLIVEYMIYKVKNGYEPSFSSEEFLQFLAYYQHVESKLKVQDFVSNKDTLFKGFYERKLESHWSHKNYQTGEIIYRPHMNLSYDDNQKDFILSANYQLSSYDESILNTYLMPSRSSVKKRVQEIIGDYLKHQDKRMISDVEVNESDIMTGKCIAAEIVRHTWLTYIDKEIEKERWPKQCRDISKYLFDIDLAEIIEVPSVKQELIDLYKELSKRMAIMIHQDKDIQISSRTDSYLARANFDLFIQGYEYLLGGYHGVFSTYNKVLDINMSSSTFKESHEIPGVYDWDDDAPVKTTTTHIDSDQFKQLVKTFEEKK